MQIPERKQKEQEKGERKRLLQERWKTSIHSFKKRCSLEGMMLKLKLQYFGHLIRRVDSLEKTLMLGGIGGRRRRGRQRMRWLDGITDSMDRSQASLQKAQGPGVCKLPKPPASRALCQAKRAPRAAFPSPHLNTPALWTSQYGCGISDHRKAVTNVNQSLWSVYKVMWIQGKSWRNC